MNNKATNRGVYMMPVVLILASVAFWSLQGYGYALASFVLGVLFFVMVWANPDVNTDKK